MKVSYERSACLIFKAFMLSIRDTIIGSDCVSMMNCYFVICKPNNYKNKMTEISDALSELSRKPSIGHLSENEGLGGEENLFDATSTTFLASELYGQRDCERK